MFFVLLVIFASWYRRIVPRLTAKLSGLKNVPKDHVNSEFSYHLDSLPGGHFVQLGHGKTRYYLFGPEDGKRIVLLHGIGTASIVWKYLGTELATKGYRVLVFDLWGRGYSDCPGHIYDDELFVTQLYMLMTRIGWNSAIICGWSLGGAVAAAFTYQFPDMVNELYLIASAGLVNNVPFTAKLVRFPFIGEFLMHTIGPKLMQMTLTRLNKHDREYLEKYPHIKILPQLLTDHLAYSKGFLRAYHSSLVNFPLGSMQPVFKELGRSFKKPVKIIWGKEDEIVPYTCCEELVSYMPDAMVVLTSGRHDIVVTQPSLILKTIITN